MNIIAFDTETKGLNWFDPAEQAFLATWADGDSEYQADLSKPRETARFLAALKSADVLVAHNFSFDCHQVRATTGFDILASPKYLRGEQELHDTDLMSRVMFPEGQRKGERGGHGLKNLAKVFLRADAADAEDKIKEMAKSIGLRTLKQTGAYYEVWRAYPDAMETYARMDARHTYDIFTKFNAQMTDQARGVYELEMAVMPVFIAAEQRGVALDPEVVQRLVDETTARRDAAIAQLRDEFGEQALGGPGSDKALLEALERLGVPLHRKTPTGELSTDKFALQEFEDSFPQIALLQELRQSEKFLSTYLQPMVGRDTVHPSFFQCGAWTGRASCSRPNMQNIPKRAGKEVRSMFVPRDGHVFVVADYEAIEVRLLAHYMGNLDYRELIASGHDPHAWMASNLHGGAAEDYAKGTDGQVLRDVAKNTTFAICYGAGAPRVSDMNKITRDEAKQLISHIKRSLPGFYNLNTRIRDKVSRVGHVNTLFGRRQPVSPEKAYVGLNALIQGSAADIMKQGMVNVASAIGGFDAHILLVVHDEVVVECPREHAERCRQVVEHAMCAAFALKPPLAVESTIAAESYAVVA